MTATTTDSVEYYLGITISLLIPAASVLFTAALGAILQTDLGQTPAITAMLGWAIGAGTVIYGPRVLERVFSQDETDTRGAVRLIDVIMTFFVLVPIIVLAPVFYKFTGMVSSQADPFSGLLLQLMVPLLLVGLILSVGVSARGR